MSHVIEKSFNAWNDAPGHSTERYPPPAADDRQQLLDALENHPEFIRLCLLLALLKRNDDPPRRIPADAQGHHRPVVHYRCNPSTSLRSAHVSYLHGLRVEGLFVDHG